MASEATPVTATTARTDVEQEVIEEARAWVDQEMGFPGKVLDRVGSVSRGLVERVLETDRGESAMNRTSQWLMKRLDAAIAGIASEPPTEGARASQADPAAALADGDELAQQV